jgi:sterol desaturase/sphingolipid hydroxylase (fatty acid hydroxylase superfamily)
MLDMSVDLGLGTAAWLVAWLIPFRTLTAQAELGWDVLGLICTYVFATFAEVPLDALLEWGNGPLVAWTDRTGTAPWWVIVPTFVLVADCGAYWAHRALHCRWLWSTHAWHHAPKNLYWIAGLRGSPIHILVLLAPYWLAFMLFPVPQAGLIGAALLVLDTGNQHLIHSNIHVPFARHVEWVFVTPRFHFVHHNRQPEIANSNFGFVFSFWDRLFGTYTDPDHVPVDAELGIDYEISNWRLLIGLPPPRRRYLEAAPPPRALQ